METVEDTVKHDLTLKPCKDIIPHSDPRQVIEEKFINVFLNCF